MNISGVCKVCQSYTVRDSDGEFCLKCRGKGFIPTRQSKKDAEGRDIAGYFNGIPFTLDDKKKFPHRVILTE